MNESSPHREPSRPGSEPSPDLEVSVVIPCLNEAETVGTCVEKGLGALQAHGISGEVVVADNGSSDGSPRIAEERGARVVHVAAKGYGSALMGGIEAAGGRFVIMADADDSYDLREVPRFVERLREGHDLVVGCRLPSGGGTIEEGAMPFLHKYLGNPGFSWLARWWFGVPVNDVHCGMRGFRRTLPAEIGQRCTGMEFATEMLIKAQLHGSSFAELPITLHRDGRVSGTPHLRTFRDGWRHLRFYLLFSPTWLFLAPGAALILLGIAGYGIALPGLSVRGVQFDVHTLLFATLFVILGYQSILFGTLTRVYGVTRGLFPPSAGWKRAFEAINLERGLLSGATLALLGGGLLLVALVAWIEAGLGPLDYQSTLRFVIPGAGMVTLGVQTILFSFFFSLLGLETR
jgi:glycosyltransferase involved in cell wall biosynthesis